MMANDTMINTFNSPSAASSSQRDTTCINLIRINTAHVQPWNKNRNTITSILLIHLNTYDVVFWMKAKLFFLQCTLPTVYMPQRKKREPKQDYLPTGDKMTYQ